MTYRWMALPLHRPTIEKQRPIAKTRIQRQCQNWPDCAHPPKKTATTTIHQSISPLPNEDKKQSSQLSSAQDIFRPSLPKACPAINHHRPFLTVPSSPFLPYNYRSGRNSTGYRRSGNRDATVRQRNSGLTHEPKKNARATTPLLYLPTSESDVLESALHMSKCMQRPTSRSAVLNMRCVRSRADDLRPRWMGERNALDQLARRLRSTKP